MIGVHLSDGKHDTETSAVTVTVAQVIEITGRTLAEPRVETALEKATERTPMARLESPNLPRFLTPDEVSVVLNVSRSHVYQLVQRGTIPSHRIGNGRGPIRVSDRDLLDFISRCRSQKSEEVPKPVGNRRRLKHLRL